MALSPAPVRKQPSAAPCERKRASRWGAAERSEGKVDMSVHTIEVRNLRFPLDAQVPKRWFGGAAQSCTTFWDNLSVLFPAGERFFMNSVRAFEAQLTDPALRDE